MLGISTCWWEGKGHDGEAIPVEAMDMGFAGLELDYRITRPMLMRMRPTLRHGIPVWSVHHVFPAIEQGKGRRVLSADPVSLSSSDAEERRLAVRLALSTIQHAHDLEAKAVVIHVGRVEMDDPTPKLEELHKKGLSWEDEGQGLIVELRALRERSKQRNIDAALFSLEAINKEAEKRGILIGIENRLHFHEIPDMAEIGFFLEKFSGGNLRYWHDVGHGCIQEKLGILKQVELLEKYSGQMIGIHLHDVKGLEDHFPPGQGDVDFFSLAKYLHPGIARILEVRSSATRREILESVEFLKEKGL